MAAGARLGARAARPGVLVPGAASAPDPPASWPPAGLTLEEKIDLLMAHIGPPRWDVIPGDWTLTELVVFIAGGKEA
jgi:hypothetical protein